MSLDGFRADARAWLVENGFDARELGDARAFLAGRAASIYSGSNEIQRNIVAKRVHGLPD